MGLLSDLRAISNRGRELRLYDGTKVRVRAMSLPVLEELDQSFPTWFGRLAQAVAEGVAVTPGGVDVRFRQILESLRTALPDWRGAFVIILSDSNPDMAIDLEWCRKHLHLPDLGPIVKAWFEENDLTWLLDEAKKKLRALVMETVRASSGASPSASSASAGPSIKLAS